MKFNIIASPCGEDIMLRINETPGQVIHRIVLTHSELHELEWAIRKYLEGQPMRNLKEATGRSGEKEK